MLNGKCIVKSDLGQGVVVKATTRGTTLETLELKKGWYRFSTAARTVYPCPSKKNCKGGIINGSDVAKSLCKDGAGE